MEEIFNYVLWEIRRSGYERKLIGGIVLTGGGALLNHVEKLADLCTGMSTRIGMPQEHLAHGYKEQINSPIYSTGIGLLLRGLQELGERPEPAQSETPAQAAEPSNVSEEKSQSWLDNVLRKTREWFEAEPDIDLEKTERR